MSRRWGARMLAFLLAAPFITQAGPAPEAEVRGFLDLVGLSAAIDTFAVNKVRSTDVFASQPLAKQECIAGLVAEMVKSNEVKRFSEIVSEGTLDAWKEFAAQPAGQWYLEYVRRNAMALMNGARPVPYEEFAKSLEPQQSASVVHFLATPAGQVFGKELPPINASVTPEQVNALGALVVSRCALNAPNS